MQKVSNKAASLIGSEIIKLGAEINQKIKEGHQIYNLTIGDFNPEIFPIPDVLKQYIVDAYTANQTNYPAADGMPELKQAVLNFIFQQEQIKYSNDEILIASGGRPVIYAAYQTIVDPTDKVIYPVPSWNNNHYCHLSDAQKIEIPTQAKDGFMPTANELKPHLADAALLALCSPLNPTGTTFRKEELEKICDLVLAENKRRLGIQKPLYVLFDQIYWMLRAEGIEHHNPVALRPEMKAYTVFVDGISKSLSATGVRVGWGFGPEEVIGKMKSILGHIGAWAPKPEQVATASFLSNKEALQDFINKLEHKILKRFHLLFEGFELLAKKGFPVEIIKPEGAIYLSVRFNIFGKVTLEETTIDSTNAITAFLLNKAQLALVPFTAFGCDGNTDWYRISIGTLKIEEIDGLFLKLEKALSELK